MTNRIAIITGGSRGLGRNTAVNLARRGVDVLFTYRANQKEAKSLIREAETIGRKAAGFRLDTGDVRAFDDFVTEVRKTLKSWGRERFDYLVNNAGNSLHTAFAETTEAQFDEIFHVHVKGVYFRTCAVCSARQFRLRISKGSGRGADPLPGQGTRATRDHRERRRTRRDPNRL